MRSGFINANFERIYLHVDSARKRARNDLRWSDSRATLAFLGGAQR